MDSVKEETSPNMETPPTGFWMVEGEKERGDGEWQGGRRVVEVEEKEIKEKEEEEGRGRVGGR